MGTVIDSQRCQDVGPIKLLWLWKTGIYIKELHIVLGTKDMEYHGTSEKYVLIRISKNQEKDK